MADENLESSLTEGSAGSPNSAASQGKGDKPPSTFDASKLPEQLESLVEKAVAKAVQSTKDKRFSDIEKQLGDFKPVLERVKDMLTPEQLAKLNQIQRDAEFEEMKQTVAKLTQTGTPATGTQQSAANSEAQGILQNYGLDGNDPEVVSEVLSKPQAERELSAAKLAYRRATQPPPSPAAASAMQGQPAKPEDVEGLTKNYQKEMLAARGKREELKAIKERYRKAGVPVDTIVFY